ncbi:MAG: tyrosine-type recombinase/integrase [Bacteroidetes bacterium]|nr:tyrosine-type recombinase/integrase [Bacteroidota bacterium]MBT7289526.1 tyrosine-type recombinase/integrase [Chloroflexota bacterium]
MNLLEAFLGPEGRRRLMLRQLDNEKLFTLYDSDLVLRLHNEKNLKDTRKILAEFKRFLGDRKPSGDLAKSYLSQYSNRKPRTLYRYAQMIRVFMKWYGEPMNDFKVKRPKSLPEFIEDADIEKLFAAIKDKRSHKGVIERDTLLVELALKTGLRRGELANLAAGDIHDDFLVVREGKNNKDRTIPLTPNLAQKLHGFIEGKRRDEKVFGLAAPSITLKIKAFAKKAGLHNIHAHALRHKFATDLLHHGADVRSVQHLLGHENLSTTQVYLSVNDSRLRDAVNLLEDNKKEEGKQVDLQSIVTIKSVSNKSIWPPSNVIPNEYFSHFEISNEGNEPVVQVEVVLLSGQGQLIETQKETVVGVKEKVDFKPSVLLQEGEYCIICQYKAMENEAWNESSLAVRLKNASKEGEVYIIDGELEFK